MEIWAGKNGVEKERLLNLDIDGGFTNVDVIEK
jgi:hypothetical protein